MKILCGACHTGQAKALVPVVELLVKMGHEVRVALDRNQPASSAYDREQIRFPASVEVVIPQGGGLVDPLQALAETAREEVSWADRALIMLSPTKEVYTVERMILKLAFGRMAVYAYSEVPCGHLAPVWEGVLEKFHGLFVAKKTTDLNPDNDAIVEVGIMPPPEINIRQVYETKAALGVGEMDSWIWYMGGPYARAGEILEDIVRNVRDIPIVFSRHGRDKQDHRSVFAYGHAVADARQRGVSIIENSLDHGSSETTEAQRADRIPYARLFEACAANGILVTGHGTDGIKAPYVGIPSILCGGNDLNPHIFLEKGCEKLPLPDKCPLQVTTIERLQDAITFFLQPGIRDQYVRECLKKYPKREKSPAEIIAGRITR